MFCRKCGNSLNENDVFCVKCGEPVKSLSKEPAAHQQRVVRKIDIESLRSADVSEDEFDEERVESDDIISTQNVLDALLNEDETLDMPEEAVDISEDNLYGDDTSDEDTYDEDDSDDDDFYDDDDDDIEETKARIEAMRAARAQRRAKQKASRRMMKIIIPGVILVMVICLMGVMFIFNWLRDRKFENFKVQYENYIGAMKEYGVEYGDFVTLQEDAKKTIDEKDFSEIDKLSDKLKEAIEKMKGDAATLSLKELKTQYDAVFSKYQIPEDQKAVYDELMQKLDDAINNRNESQARDLRKEFEALDINLTTANQQLVQAAINEIHKIDTAKAADDEKQLFASYKEQVDASAADGNYIEAFKLLDEWKAAAKDAEERIRESKEKERLEKESIARKEKEKAEAESRAKESEEESRAKESEEAKENAGGGKYILSGSDSRYVTKEEVLALSKEQRKLARNEIFARHGRKFKTAEIQAYFNAQSWYHGTVDADNFDASVFNKYEKKNISLIKSLE